MYIQHNMAAVTANRFLYNNERIRHKSQEKLSSGYRINRAADDAACLTISEKMRAQIRGLQQASDNVQDGISLIQTADGALAEVHSIVQRGRELCIQAANDTLCKEDRECIQREIAQLQEEIDAISERSEFNTIKILQSPLKPRVDKSLNVIVVGGIASWIGYTSTNSLSEVYTTQEKYCTDPNDQSGKSDILVDIDHASVSLDFSKFNGSQSQIDELIGGGFYSTCCTCTNHYSVEFTDSTESKMVKSGSHYVYKIGIRGVTNVDELFQRIIDGTDNGNPGGHFTKLTADSATKKLIIYDDRSREDNPLKDIEGYSINGWIDWDHVAFNIKPSGNRGRFGDGVIYDAEDLYKLMYPRKIWLQVGANAQQMIDVDLPTISSYLLRINKTDVTSQKGATQGIDDFSYALAYTSRHRSRMGAYQNRLEHAASNLESMTENVTSAESRIRDANMADEIVKLTKTAIVEQSIQAMLAHANRQTEGILALLQG